MDLCLVRIRKVRIRMKLCLVRIRKVRIRMKLCLVRIRVELVEDYIKTPSIKYMEKST